jgi:hypothetical protein
MPWQVDSNLQVSYLAREVQHIDSILPLRKGAETIGRVAKVHNISIKRFRLELRKMQTRENIKAFQLVEVSSMDCRVNERNSIYKRIKSLLKVYSDVFKYDLPDGLPKKRSVDHVIETQHGANPPNRSLYQLSPAELEEAK